MSELVKLERNLEAYRNGRETAKNILEEYKEKYNHWDKTVKEYNQTIWELENKLRVLREENK